MMKRLLSIFLLLTTTTFAMNGIQQIGYGTKARGMGGASIALPQDIFTIANNPAGLVHLACRLEGGLQWLHQQGHLHVNEAPPIPTHHYTGRNLVWPELGANIRYSPGGALGIAMYCYGGFETLYHPSLLLYGLHHFGIEFKQFVVAPAWSLKIGCGMSLGIAVNAVFSWAQVKGLERVLGLEPTQTPSTESPPYATNKGPDHQEGVSIRVGWLWNLPGGWSLGATYQTQTWVNRFKLYRGFFADRGDMGLPSQVGVGAAWKPCQQLRLAADFLYIFWSDIAQMGNSGNLTQFFGSSTGPGFNWRDQPVLKLGASWNVAPCFEVRAGYNYSPCPFRASDIFLNTFNVGMVEHHLTAGLTYSFCCYELSFAGVYGFHNHLMSPELDPLGRLCGRQYGCGIGLARRF